MERLMGMALDAADSARAVDRHWPGELDSSASVRVLGVGKAAGAMTDEAVGRLGDRCAGAVGVCVPGSVGASARVEWYEADHPVPTARNVEAAERVASFVSELDKGDTLLVLLSGGGSAHLALPAEGIALDDLRGVTERLIRAGTPIGDLNAVRKHCERLKGGRLAELAAPARVIVLVLSDVMGDRLDTIASGPFAPDTTTYSDAMRVLESNGIVSGAVFEHVRRGVSGAIAETAKDGDACFDRVEHVIVGSNRSAVEAVVRAAEELGFRVAGIEHGVEGAAAGLGRRLTRSVIKYDGELPVCFVVGGESTVDASGASGVGGRNQELALAAAIEMNKYERCTLLALATDGADGPTPAAGAIVCSGTAEQLRRVGVDPERALAEHDSYTGLNAVGATLKPGPTGTNVNDIAVVARYAD